MSGVFFLHADVRGGVYRGIIVAEFTPNGFGAERRVRTGGFVADLNAVYRWASAIGVKPIALSSIVDYALQRATMAGAA